VNAGLRSKKRKCTKKKVYIRSDFGAQNENSGAYSGYAVKTIEEREGE
jgi:hypothetical protein